MKPGTYAHFETSMGNFTIELFEGQAPKTVANFVELAEIDAAFAGDEGIGHDGANGGRQRLDD